MSHQNDSYWNRDLKSDGFQNVPKIFIRIWFEWIEIFSDIIKKYNWLLWNDWKIFSNCEHVVWCCFIKLLWFSKIIIEMTSLWRHHDVTITWIRKLALIWPLIGCLIWYIADISDDFPAPVRPMIPIFSPDLKSRFIPFKIGMLFA